MEESYLIACFKMLIERLNSVERRCDDLQRIAQNEQKHKTGFVNTAPWDWNIDLFVHKPISPRLGPFDAPYAFYLQTNINSPRELEDVILHKTMDHEFDGELIARGADLDTIRLSFQQELDHLARLDRIFEETGEELLESFEPITCHKAHLKSQRLFVVDHLKDVLARRWGKVHMDGKWVEAMFDTQFGLAIWMVPAKNEQHPVDCLGCCEAMLNLFEYLGLEKPANVQLCGLDKYEFDFLRRMELLFAYTCYENGRDVPSRAQEWQDFRREARSEWVDTLGAHPLWEHCQRWLS